MDTGDRLLDLISLIYETVERPDRWDQFLDRFADAVSGTATTLILYTPESRLGGVRAGIRFDPEARRLYDDHYVTLDAWGVYGSHLLHPGKVLFGWELCPDHLLQASEFYADFCRPNDIHHQFCGIISRHGPTVAFLSSTRSHRSVGFEDADRRILSALLPHLQHAQSLHSRLAYVAQERQWLSDSLDRLPFGVAMISSRGIALQLNACAERILASNDGIRWDCGVIVALRPDETRHLAALVKSATMTGAGRGVGAGGSGSISRPSGRRPFRLLVSPFKSSLSIPGMDVPAATLFIFDPDAEPDDPRQTLARLYGLTPGESRVAAMLMRGLDIVETAEQLGIARSTTRNVVKRLFAKTGTNRQAELVRALLIGPAQLL